MKWFWKGKKRTKKAAEDPDFYLYAIVRSEVGKVRKKNEDSAVWVDPKSPEDRNRMGFLAVLADGMGGYQAGDVASRICVDSVRKHYYDHKGPDPHEQLVKAVKEAHRKVRQYADANQLLGKMGTTCTAAAFFPGRALIVQVGDSRLYRLHSGKLNQVTTDQTMAQQLYKNGQIKAEEVQNHPQAHILTQALGVTEPLQPVRSTIRYAGKDKVRFLLCSDGLSNEVQLDKLSEILRSSTSLSRIDKMLYDRVMESPARDNFTYICVDYDGERKEVKETTNINLKG